MIFIMMPPLSSVGFSPKSAFGTKKEKQTDGNDDDRFYDHKGAVGEKEGNEDPKTKREDGYSDQLPKCIAFHKAAPFCFLSLSYAKAGKKEQKKRKSPPLSWR